MKPIREAGPMALFGARLRALRQHYGMTQMAVAEQMCIDRTTYNKYEAGKVSPDHQGLLKLAAMFHVTVDYLLGREETPLVSLAEGEDVLAISEQEKALIQCFRQMSPEEQDHLMEQVRRVSENH